MKITKVDTEFSFVLKDYTAAVDMGRQKHTSQVKNMIPMHVGG